MKLIQSDIQPRELFSKYHPTSRLGKVFHHPLLRFIIILLFFVPIFLVNSLVVFQLIIDQPEPLASYIDIIRMLISIPLFILSYRFYCQIIEKRDAVEIGLKGSLKEWLIGSLVATMLILLFVSLIELIGDFIIVDWRSNLKMVNNFFMFGIGALFQDVILLCVIYRLIEEYAGSWIAIIISLTLFAAVHLLNENENLLSAFMLILSSVIMLAPFILTRKIWFTWGFHTGWNFLQAGVFGMPNSGIKFDGWIISEVQGPEWLTGGEVGLEASYLSVGIEFVIGLLILMAAIKSGKIIGKPLKSSDQTD